MSDIVFEGIIEKLEIKQDYFAKMDAIFPVSTILATNTSAISITEIAEKSVHKERIIGTHYWNPAYLVPLVEVIKTKYVSDETVQATYDLLKEAGKRPVIVKKDVPGFLANRMQHALFREALNIIEQDIADPADVDDAIKYGFGYASWHLRTGRSYGYGWTGSDLQHPQLSVPTSVQQYRAVQTSDRQYCKRQPWLQDRTGT